MATYYWVGGSGNWDATDTTNWSDTSGGSGGFGPPTATDDVIFDAGSNVGTGSFIVTVTGTSAAPAVCNDFSTGGAGGDLDGAMTLTMGATERLDCYGSLTLPATNFTWTATSGAILTFKATTTGKTITTNGVSMSATTFTFDGVGGEWTLGSALTISGSAIIVTNGSFNSGNYNISCGGISSNNSNIRSIVLGSSTATFTGTAVVTFTTPTNLTFDAGTSTIVCSGASATFTGGNQTFYDINFTSAASGTHVMTGANTFNNFTVASRSAPGQRALTFGANITVNGTLTLGTANLPDRRFIVSANNNAASPAGFIGLQRTITAASVAALADIDFRDIGAAGASAPWSGTRLGDAGNNSGITFDAPKSVWWNLPAGGTWISAAWALSEGGLASINNIPLPQDTAYFTDTGLNSGATMSMSTWWIGGVDCSARTLPFTFAWGAADPQCYGDFILSSSATVTGTTTPSLVMYGQNKTQILNTAGVTMPMNVFQTWNPGGGVTLAGNTTMVLTPGVSGSTTVVQGTFDLAGYTFTTAFFNSSQSTARTLAFGNNGKMVITGAAGTVWSTSTVTNLTVTGTGTAPLVEFDNATASGTRRADFGAAGETNAIDVTWLNGGGIIDQRTTNSAIRNLRYEDAVTATLTINAAMIVYGDLYIGTGLAATTVTSNSITFAASSGTQTITTNGQTINFNLAINSAGTTVVLADSLTMASARNIALNAGTFTPGQNVTVGNFITAATGVKTLNMGSTTWTLTGLVWTIGSAATLTLNAGTSNINITGGGFTFTGAGLTYYNVDFQSSSNIASSSLFGANTFNNLTFTSGPAPSHRNFFIDSNIVVNGTFTVASTSLTQQVYVLATPAGITETITAAAVSSLSYVMFRDITAAGASAPWSGTALGNCGGNTNITFGAPRTLYWNLPAGGVWTDTAWATTPTGSPSVANYPLPQDTAIFTDAGLSVASTVTMDGGYQMPGIDFSGMTNAVTFDVNSQTPGIYGNITFSSAVTLANTGSAGSVTISQYSGTQSITMAGRSWSQPTSFSGAYATYQIVGTFTNTNFVALNHGTIDLNGQAFVCQTWVGSATTPRGINFNGGYIEVTGFNATVWSMATVTNFGFTGVSDVRFTYSGSTGTRTITTAVSAAIPNAAMNFKITDGTDIIALGGTGIGSGNLDFTGTPGFTGTFSNLSRNILGNLTLNTGMTVAVGSGSTIFVGPGGTQTITSNGVTFGQNIQINSAITTVALADNLTLDSTRTVTMLTGFLNLNNNTLSTGAFASSGTAVRGVNFGTGRIQVTGNNATILSLGTSFVNTGSKLIEVTYAGSVGTRTLTISNTGEENQWNVSVTAGSDIITTTGNTYFNNLDFTGFSGTFAHVIRFFYGNVTLSPTMTVAGGTSAWTWVGLAKTTKTLTTNGVTLDIPIIVAQGTDSVLALGDALTMTAARTLTVLSGSFDTANQAMTVGLFSSATTSVRSINLGSSAIDITGVGTAWNTSTTTNLTFNAGTSTITFSGTGGGVSAAMGGLTYYDVTLSTGLSNDVINNFNVSGANTFRNLTLTAPTVTGRKFTSIGSNQNITGTLTISGATAVNRMVLSSNSNATLVTVTAAAVNLAQAEFRNITAAGAIPWTGTGLGDQGGNTNIVFATPKAVYWSSLGGGNWSDTAWATTSGGVPNTANFPLPQDTAVIDNAGINAGSTIIIDSQWTLPAVNCSELTNAITINHTLTGDIAGNMTLAPSITFTGSGRFFTLNNIQLTSNGAVFSQNINVGRDTLTLMDNFQTTGQLELTIGTLNLNNTTATCAIFIGTGTNTRRIDFGTGQIVVTGNDATVFDMRTATGFTYTGTPTVNLTYAGAVGDRQILFGNVGGATEANVLNVNITAGSDRILLGAPGSYGSLNFTGFSGAKGLNNQNLTFYRDLTWSGTMTAEAGTGSVIFAATSGTQTLTTNGLTLDFPLQVTAPGATVALGSALTMGSTQTLTLTAGTFDAVNYNVTTGLFAASGTATRTLLMGSGQWTLTGTGTSWDITDATAMTLTAGSSTIRMIPGTTSLGVFAGGGLVYNNFVYDPATASSVNRGIIVSGTNTWNNFTVSGVPSNQRYAVLLSDNQTVTGTLTLSGSDPSSRVYFSAQSNTSSLASVSAASINLSYVDFKGVTAAGAAIPWSGTSLGNMGGNTNITFDTPKTVYWNQPTGGSWSDVAWALTSGGPTDIANYPLAQDTVIFDDTGTGAGNIINMSGEFQIGTWNCGGLTNAVTFDMSNGQASNGDVTLSSAVTISGASSWNFNFPNKNYTITSGGATITVSSVIVGLNTLSSNITLADNLTLGSSSNINLLQGNINLNGRDLTTGIFLSNNSNARSIAFAGGQINITGNNTTVWGCNTLTNFSYTGTSVVNLTYAGGTGTRGANNGSVAGTSSAALNFNVTAGTDTVDVFGQLLSVNYTGFAGTATLQTRTYYGDLIIPAGIATSAGTNQILTFAATSGTQTINVVPALPAATGVTINAPGATVQLAANLVIDATRTLTLTAGTFDSAGFAVTAGFFVSNNANTRTLTMGSSAWTLLGGTTSWNITDATNMTLNSGTSTIVLSNNSPEFQGGGLTYYDLNLTSTSLGGLAVVSGNNTFNNLTLGGVGTTAAGSQLNIGGNQTVNGTLTIQVGGTGSRRLLILSDVAGTARTITAASVAALSDISFEDITAAGAAIPWSGTRLGDAGNNTNITFAAGVNKYWSLPAGGAWNATAWATTSGGTPSDANFPLPQDTVIFDDAGLGTNSIVTMVANQQIGTLDFSARTQAMTFSLVSFIPNFFGNLIMATPVNFVSTTGTLAFNASAGTQTVTTAGAILYCAVRVATAPTVTVQLQDNLNNDGYAFTLQSGTLDLNDFDITTRNFNGGGTSTRTLDFGTGEINVIGNNITVFTTDVATNLTVLGTPVVNCTYAGFTGTRDIVGSSVSGTEANSISINITAGGDTVGVLGLRSYRNVNFTDFSGTLSANTGTRIIYGDLTLGSNMVWLASTGTTSLQGTLGTYTITTNGVTVNAPVEINAPGGTYQLGSAWTQGTAYDFTLTAGAFDTQNYNLATRAFVSNNTNTRALTLGSSVWTLTASSSIRLWDIEDSTGMTLTADTSEIVFDINTTGTVSFWGGGLSYHDFTVDPPSDTVFVLSLYGVNNNFNDVTITAPPVLGRSSIQPYDNFTINGTFSMNGNSATQNFAMGYNLGSAVTIIAGSISLSYITFRYITADGPAIPWSGTGFGDGGNNTNILFDPARTVYWSNTAGGAWSSNSWSDTLGGTPDPQYFPLAQDTAVFDNTGWGAGTTLTIDGGWSVGGFDASALTDAMLIDFAEGSFNIYGNVEFSSAITTTGTGTGLFLSGTQTVDFAGVPVSCYVTKSVSGTTTTLLSDVVIPTAPAYFRLNNGTVDFNGFDITCPIWVIAAGALGTRALEFNGGIINVTGNDATVWQASDIDGFSYTGTPTVNFTYSGSVGTRLIQHGITTGLTEARTLDFNILYGSDNVTLTGPGGVRNLIFADAYSGRSNLIGGGFIYGSLRLSPNQTLTVGSNTTFAATSGTNTIETNGLQIGSSLTFDGVGGTWQLSDALSTTNQVTLISGTFDSNNQIVSCQKFAFQGSNVKVIDMGSSDFYLGNNPAATASALWDQSSFPTNLTINTGTSTIYLQKNSVTGSQSFWGGGFVYHNLVISGNTVPTTIYGSNTFNSVSNLVAPLTISFEAGTTQTVTDWTVNGTAGQQVVLQSDTPGVQWNLAKAGGGYVVVLYCTISDSAASPGTTWYAPVSIGALT